MIGPGWVAATATALAASIALPPPRAAEVFVQPSQAPRAELHGDGKM
jgi:hypothetical protein